MSLPLFNTVALPSRTQLQAAEVKHTLAAAREKLKQGYAGAAHARALLAAQSRLIDDTLKLLWRGARMPSTTALIAVGGYGRGELYPYSDIDLLLLLPARADPDLAGKLEEFVSVLWDIGLALGHSVRTVPECVELCAHDVTVQTSLLEARLVAGSRNLTAGFKQAVHGAIDPQQFYRAKLLEQQQRHERTQETNLEPNIKESAGGLRDLHNMLWIGRAGGVASSWRGLVARGVISPQEARAIKRGENLLQDLRIRLHYLADRREDRLLFDFQQPLALEVGLADRPGKLAGEQLMQRFYRTANTLRQVNTIVLQNLGSRILPVRQDARAPINERFHARNERLEASSDDLFEREPGAILESFWQLQEHPELKGMSAPTLRALWRARERINPAFRRDPDNRAMFMRILRHHSLVIRELRRMNEYGILGDYIPAFGRIVGQMQHDLYHVYTVDQHILKVVRNVRRFTVAELAHEFPLCSRLINDFARPEVLYLGALFHDIAKGRGGNHSTLGAHDARRFCRDHGLSAEDVALVEWLVQNHLLMSFTAQKQDLSDPDVVSAFAHKVGDDRHLVALYLLTVADVRGTSPRVWNAWKAKLLEDLFWMTRRVLAGDTISTGNSVEARQQEALAKLRLYAVPEGVQEKLWKQLDTGYFLRHDAQEIAWHTRLLNYRVDSPAPVVKSRLAPFGEGLQVMIYTRDQPGLFARICSFFDHISWNVVEAKIHTTRHGYALDSFVILDPHGRAPSYRDLASYIEHELTERLERQAPLEPPSRPRLSRRLKHFPITPEINIQPDERGAYQILSVIAGDRPGLLYRIARVLVEYDIDLHSAKIDTLGERAEDTFLISGAALKDAKTVLRLETELVEQLKT